MDFQIVKDILTSNWPMFVRGTQVTLLISLIGTVVGTFIGLMIGVVRTIPIPDKGFKKYLLKVINGLLAFYIEFFRGTPMMVQSMVIYFGVASLYGIQLNKLWTAMFIVSINTGAYMAEIVRGGIFSIDKGQTEAAHALGMNHFETMRYIILPQVIRNILPATGNELVINVKDTSVLNVIGVSELFFASRSIAGSTYRFFEVYLITCLIYFFLTIVITRVLRIVEKKMDGPSSYDRIGVGNQMQVTTPEFK